MANIFLIVEGETEEQFYKNQLQKSYLLPDGAYRHYFFVRLIPNKRGIHSRAGSGGQVSYDSCVDIVKRFFGWSKPLRSSGFDSRLLWDR